ncbi:MAG TPA: ribonucleotide reductase N-terminal alpha domain-containing protein, partial [Planococcus sp. (in: firmicutes)]|nr:ribonucleotide reductase N-terminal alpha domain-containing protein [Planococcus sp. (in: firmicutes)]
MKTEMVNETGAVERALQSAEQLHGLDTEALRNKIGELDGRIDTEKSMLYALNRISMDEPNWTFLAAELYASDLYRQAAASRGYQAEERYGDFYHLIEKLSRSGIYSNELMDAYSEAEIRELGAIIEPDRDLLFNYIGLFLLADRYLAKDYDAHLHELPQERFLVIAMTLMKNEKKDQRIALVKEAYWAMSNLYMTVATPTLSNAGKSFGQLSSCFIDTVDDSLDGIYLNNWDIARLSKDGGGLGVYYGKVRALGSDIKKFKSNSSGVIPWIRLINDTAVSVDQLGQRQGAVAIYLDVFHKDIMNGFLDLKTNNGDERRKAHDIFTGVTLPDLFMEKLSETDENGRSVGEWQTFCPHQVKQVMGWKDENGKAL